MIWPFSKVIKVKCPDGTERLVYKNPEDIFPLYAKDWSSKFDSAMKTSKELQGKVGATYNSKVSGFFAQLDQANRNMQISLRALYVVYSLNPCHNDKWLAAEVQKALGNENFLRRIQYEIDILNCLLKNKAPIETVVKAIDDSTKRLQMPELEYKTSAAFDKAQKDVTVWEATDGQS